jgi:hypothetical protein
LSTSAVTWVLSTALQKQSIFMPRPFDKDLVEILARAFDAAWQDYYGRPGCGTLPQEMARSALASFLVARAKDGMTDEAAMAAAGLEHLISLLPIEPDQTQAEKDVWRLGCIGRARFSDMWRVRIMRIGDS